MFRHYQYGIFNLRTTSTTFILFTNIKWVFSGAEIIISPMILTIILTNNAIFAVKFLD